MPEFVWRAVAASGAIEQGRLTSSSAAAVLKHLRNQGLTPLSVEDVAALGRDLPDVAPAGILLSLKSARQQKGPVTSTDVLTLTSEMAIMLRAGLALDSALRVLADMSHKPSIAALVHDILNAVKGGASLSRALAQHRNLFGDFYINMVRSGEVSGQMSTVLDRLVEHMERQRALRDGVISAMIYPAILLGVAVLSLIAMLGFVVPQFEKLFTDMGDALPMPTRFVMGLGQMFTSYGLIVGIVVAALVVMWMKWIQSPVGANWWQMRLLRLPLMGRLALQYQLTLFSRSLGTLLGNGVPLLTALHIATETVGNSVLRSALERIAPIVKDGGKMAQAIQATGAFEPIAINLIRVGEETGRIGPMMLELSNILNRAVETGIKRALTLVEPVLILVLGMLIACIIVSILLGIMSINDLAV